MTAAYAILDSFILFATVRFAGTARHFARTPFGLVPDAHTLNQPPLGCGSTTPAACYCRTFTTRVLQRIAAVLPLRGYY